jgi:hypothetical protein
MCGQTASSSGQGPVAGSREHSNKTLGSIEAGNILTKVCLFYEGTLSVPTLLTFR